MAQIAQQDRLFVEDANTLSTLSQDTKDIVKKSIKMNTILDLVLQTKESGNLKNISKVVGYEIDATLASAPTYKVHFLNTNTGDIYTLNIN